jgi:N-acetylglucosaminyldiphosphoundecaprenol N-acetyl-beta-D-mannosaminyltransferase
MALLVAPPVTTSYRTCGVRIDPMPLDDAVDAVRALARSGSGHAVHLCNAYTLSLAHGDDDYAALLDRASLNLPDGAPLVWLARRFGTDLSAGNRPRGCDVFLRTVLDGRADGLRHYLYGATPDTIAALRAELERRAPGMQIVGAEAPPFRPLTPQEEDDVAARIVDSGADLGWVGIGTPRQDAFCDRFAARVPATFMAVGAAFDFLAGAKKEAPAWMRASGTEWVYRFASEPRRLWRRYLVGNAVFARGVLAGVESVAP